MNCRLLSIGVTCLLTSSVVSPQSISFGPNPAEQCAIVARQLTLTPGRTLAIKLRHIDLRWTQFQGSNKELEARFLAENPCMTRQFPSSKCGELQQELDKTNLGSTLGERLRLIFPHWTEGMGDKYVEMYIRTFCPDITFVADPVVAGTVATKNVPSSSNGTTAPLEQASASAVTLQGDSSQTVDPKAADSVRDHDFISASDLHFRTALLAMASDDYQIASDELSAALKLSPSDPTLMVQLAVAQSKLHQYDDAIANVNKALTIGFPSEDARKSAEDLLVKLSYERLKSKSADTSHNAEPRSARASSGAFMTELTYVDADLPTNAAVMSRAKKVLHGVTRFQLNLSGNREMATNLVLLLEKEGFAIVANDDVVINFASEFNHPAGERKQRSATASITKGPDVVFRYELLPEKYLTGDNPAEAFARVVTELLKKD